MQTAQNAANHNEYRSILVTALFESASNPRKRFDETSLNELAASLKTQGVLAPLLVREADENKYEVIAGARRLRAAKLVELPSIPVRVVKLCADPNCRVHHGDKPSAQQLRRERAEERKRTEKQKLAITVRHRILAAILDKVSAPLKKADLLVLAEHAISTVPHTRIPILAKRHKIETAKSATPSVESLQKHIAKCDEDGLSRLLLEISLLEFAYRTSSTNEADTLLNGLTLSG